MTIAEFNETPFYGGIQVEYKEKIYDVMSVDFQEKLIAFNVEFDEDLKWVRCENVKLITKRDEILHTRGH